MIYILMILSILSLLFIIGAAIYTIVVSKKTEKKSKNTLHSLVSDDTAPFSIPCNDTPKNLMLTYSFKTDAVINSVLSNYGVVLCNSMRSSNKAWLDALIFHALNPETGWEHSVKSSYAEKIKVLVHSDEDVESKEMKKALLFVELKTIHYVNIEKDEDELLSGIYYLINKRGGAIDGRLQYSTGNS